MMVSQHLGDNADGHGESKIPLHGVFTMTRQH